MVGPEGVGGGECWDDADNLKKRRTVIAGDPGGGVHGLEKL